MLHKLINLLCLALLAVSTRAQQAATPEHMMVLRTANQGSIVILDSFLTDRFTRLSYSKTILPGPQFLISDDPEYIRVPEAIALQETVAPGSVRLYLYNVNGVKEPQKLDRRITAVIRNMGQAPMRLRMIRYASQPPTTNYFLAGKNGLADYFNSTGSDSVRMIAPGKAVSIDEQLERNVVKYDELVHGIYEFVIDQPGQVSVIQTDLKSTGPQALERIASVHPTNKKNAGRGLFGVSNYLVRVNDTIRTDHALPVQLVLADGKDDPWVVGTEGSTGNLSTLAGNYGVLYQVELNWKSTNGKGLALVTWNARAGDNQWCGGMANAMVVSEGKFKAGTIRLPSDALRTKKAPEAILIQVFTPPADSRVQKIRLTYSPPGASCLPTPLIFVPIDVN